MSANESEEVLKEQCRRLLTLCLINRYTLHPIGDGETAPQCLFFKCVTEEQDDFANELRYQGIIIKEGMGEVAKTWPQRLDDTTVPSLIHRLSDRAEAWSRNSDSSLEQDRDLLLAIEIALTQDTFHYVSGSTAGRGGGIGGQAITSMCDVVFTRLARIRLVSEVVVRQLSRISDQLGFPPVGSAGYDDFLLREFSHMQQKYGTYKDWSQR